MKNILVALVCCASFTHTAVAQEILGVRVPHRYVEPEPVVVPTYVEHPIYVEHPVYIERQRVVYVEPPQEQHRYRIGALLELSGSLLFPLQQAAELSGQFSLSAGAYRDDLFVVARGRIAPDVSGYLDEKSLMLGLGVMVGYRPLQRGFRPVLGLGLESLMIASSHHALRAGLAVVERVGVELAHDHVSFALEATGHQVALSAEGYPEPLRFGLGVGLTSVFILD